MIASKDKKAKTKTGSPRKFLFDQNCFDEDYEEEVIVEEPPPPSFNEQELDEARQEGYNRGKKDGLGEAAASRERQVATLLDTIGKNFKMLFDAEQKRNAQYEGEAVAVAHTIFARLFPALNKQHGLAEIEAVIASVLHGQRGAPEIVIAIHPDYRESIQERLSSLAPGMPAGCKITVAGEEGLGAGDCRMHWDNGGAGRDITFLAEEIHRQLEHILADKPTLQDNRVEIHTGSHRDSSQTIQADAEPDDNGEAG